jgi:hypothetical protein
MRHRNVLYSAEADVAVQPLVCPVFVASRATVLGWEWGRGRGGVARVMGPVYRMHAGGRICNLECSVDAGQGFLWEHGWLLQAGWQRYSTEVQQRTRTEVAA